MSIIQILFTDNDDETISNIQNLILKSMMDILTITDYLNNHGMNHIIFEQ